MAKPSKSRNAHRDRHDRGMRRPLLSKLFKFGQTRSHSFEQYVDTAMEYLKAIWSEDEIGYSILKESTLEELKPVFEDMKRLNIPATEHIQANAFWAGVRRAGIDTSTEQDRKPCECLF
jgi:hypothetical protein